MTKDGRASPLHDTRLFITNGEALFGRGVSDFDNHDALAFARRLTWWLNGEGFSIGHTPALYTYFSTALPVGLVEAEAPRFTPDDWWFRQVKVGVSKGFPDGDAFKEASEGLIAVLKALKPEDDAMIERAAQIVSVHGANCRFLLKVKDTAKQLIEISTTIGVFKQPSYLFVSITDKATGTYREAPPAKITSYDDGVYLAGKVKIARSGVEVQPRASSLSRLIVEKNPNIATWSMDELVTVDRPMMSGVLKFR